MVINLDVMMKEAIQVATINQEIDKICKQFTPYTHDIYYNLLRNVLRNGCIDLIKWYAIMNCTYIDHTIKKEAENDGNKNVQ